jgi:hypothetical protein
MMQELLTFLGVRGTALESATSRRTGTRVWTAVGLPGPDYPAGSSHDQTANLSPPG